MPNCFQIFLKDRDVLAKAMPCSNSASSNFRQYKFEKCIEPVCQSHEGNLSSWRMIISVLKYSLISF